MMSYTEQLKTLESILQGNSLSSNDIQRLQTIAKDVQLDEKEVSTLGQLPQTEKDQQEILTLQKSQHSKSTDAQAKNTEEATKKSIIDILRTLTQAHEHWLQNKMEAEKKAAAEKEALAKDTTSAKIPAATKPEEKQEKVMTVPKLYEVSCSEPFYKGKGAFNFNRDAKTFSFKKNDAAVEPTEKERKEIVAVLNNIEKKTLENFIAVNKDYKLNGNEVVDKDKKELTEDALVKFDQEYKKYREENIQSVADKECSGKDIKVKYQFLPLQAKEVIVPEPSGLDTTPVKKN